MCPRNCKAERNDETGNGFCKMPSLPVVARANIHNWEEPPISGTRGTGAVFFSGCNLKCCFCQNDEISHKNAGMKISVERLAEIFYELSEKGVHSIDLVNPTHYADAIIKALNIYKPQIPIIYNTSGYDSVETLKKLEGYIDVYLPDLKYYSREKSERYAKCPDYFEKATDAILEMHRQQSENIFNDEGILEKGLIIRHLCLPSNVEESKNILLWIKNNLPEDTLISLMSQYTPFGRANQYKEINRRLMTSEYQKVVDYFFSIGLKNGFMQEKSSAKTEYIPKFDLTGVKKD